MKWIVRLAILFFQRFASNPIGMASSIHMIIFALLFIAFTLYAAFEFVLYMLH